MNTIKQGEYKSILGNEIKVSLKHKSGEPDPRNCGKALKCPLGTADDYIYENGNHPDVYILSGNCSGPLELIAVAMDRESGNDVFVAAEKGRVIYEPEIKQVLEFCKDMGRSQLRCRYEKTCGSIVFIRENGVKKYLIIKNESGHIGFPKGHIESGEIEKETAEREVFEETGLKITVNPETRQEYTYTTLNSSIKTGVFFCNEFCDRNIKIQEEEILQSWLAKFDEAMKLLNFPEDRMILEKADKMYD